MSAGAENSPRSLSRRACSSRWHHCPCALRSSVFSSFPSCLLLGVRLQLISVYASSKLAARFIAVSLFSLWREVVRTHAPQRSRLVRSCLPSPTSRICFFVGGAFLCPCLLRVYCKVCLSFVFISREREPIHFFREIYFSQFLIFYSSSTSTMFVDDVHCTQTA